MINKMITITTINISNMKPMDILVESQSTKMATSILNKLFATVDESESEISYGSFIDNILDNALPYAMMIFCHSDKKTDTYVNMVANYLNQLERKIHIGELPDEGRVYTLDIFGYPDIKIVYQGNHIYVGSLHDLVNASERFIKTYLPSDWRIIDPEYFLTELAQATRKHIEADLGDI